MYTEVTSTGDLRNNPLAMSLHPVRIGPNYVIRSDDRNTCSFFPDSLKVKYSNNVASTETTYKTLKSYQPNPSQKTRTYKKETYEKSYENVKNSSFDDTKCGGFCSIYSCPFCHSRNGNSNCQERNYTMRSYKYSKNNGVNKSFCCTKSGKGMCNIESCEYCHKKNCNDECGFCSIDSCSYCHRNRVRTPDISMSRYNTNCKNISITERNKYLNRSNIVRTPDTNCYYRRRKIIRTSTDGNNNINYITPNEESYYLKRKIVHTPDRSCYRSKNIIDRTEENIYESRNRNTVHTPDIPRCSNLYEMYARTPNRIRDNYKYFSRIEKNRTRTPDRNYTYNYYNRVENSQEYPERTSFRTTYHTDRNYIKNEYPRTPNYMPSSHERIEIYKNVVNGSNPNPIQYDNENIYKSYNKVVVKNNYEDNVVTNPQPPKKILKKKVIKEDKNIQCSLGPKVLNPVTNYKMNTKIETIRRGVNTNNVNTNTKLKEINRNKVTKMSKVSKVSKVSSNMTNINKVNNEMKKLTGTIGGQEKKITKLKTTKTSSKSKVNNVNNVKKEPGLNTYKVKIIRIKKKIKTSENNYLLKDGEESENLEDNYDKKNTGPKNLLPSSNKQKTFEDEIYNENDEDFEDDENLNYNNNDEDFGEDDEDVPTPKMKKTSYSKREYKEYNDEHNYKDYESNDDDDNDNNEYEEKKVEKDPMGNTIVTKSKYVVKRKGVPDDFEDEKDSDNY